MKIGKFVIFREMLDYMAHICEVTYADMNWCGNAIMINGETDDETISIEVTIKKKEENEDA